MVLKVDHDAIREVRLNRPPVNALSTEFLQAIRQALEEAPRDGARAVVLSGAPGVFSAGLDLPLLVRLDRSGAEGLWRELYALMKCLASSPIPIAAAITGHAPAGGTVLALFCDWRVAARGDFKLGLTEVQVGIALPQVILAALRRQVGPRQAERLAVGGAMISPEEALAVGLVDELAASEEVFGRALAWCQRLVELPPAAMSDTRRRARADVAALFSDSEQELREVLEALWSEETQQKLQAAVANLGRKS
jgi:enoyl-CoA hydratase/carnithine racemase